MAPGASAAGLHWGSVPIVGPPPLAIAVAVGVVSIVLLAALFLLDAMATRERRAEEARSAATPPPAPAGHPASPTLVVADVTASFPDLSRREVSQLALARLRRFAAVADRPEFPLDRDLQRLARWAVFSAYRDCDALGLAPEAREVLRSGRAHGRADDLSRTA
jgi:hypothetical protein